MKSLVIRFSSLGDIILTFPPCATWPPAGRPVALSHQQDYANWWRPCRAGPRLDAAARRGHGRSWRASPPSWPPNASTWCWTCTRDCAAGHLRLLMKKAHGMRKDAAPRWIVTERADLRRRALLASARWLRRHRRGLAAAPVWIRHRRSWPAAWARPTARRRKPATPCPRRRNARSTPSSRRWGCGRRVADRPGAGRPGPPRSGPTFRPWPARCTDASPC